MNCIKGWILTGVDKLSRAPLKSEKSETDNAEINSLLHLTKSTFLISDFRLQQFKDETKSDETTYNNRHFHFDFKAMTLIWTI